MTKAMPSRRDLWLHWLVYPGHSLPTAAAPVLAAMALALHDQVFAPLPAILAFIASWLLHVAGLMTDNYELLVRHPTVNEHPELTAALQKGTFSLNGLRLAILSCIVLAVLTGPYLLYVAGTPVIVIGILGIIGSLIYSAGPFPYGKLGVGDVHFFIMFGIIAPAAVYYVQLAAYDPAASHWQLLLHGIPLRAVIVGLPLGALIVNVKIIDDMRDRGFDAEKGWRTVPVRFGMRVSRAEYLLLSAFAYLVPFWLWLRWGFTGRVLLPLLTLPAAIVIAKKVCTTASYDQLLPMTPPAAFLSFAYSALLGLGIAV